jgi:hypothetical protein
VPRKITARDSTTGKTVTFNWNDTADPTDADMDEVFAAAAAHTPAYKPEPVYLKAKGVVDEAPEPAAPAGRGVVSNEEPGTFLGGFLQSLKDQAREAFTGVQPMLQGAAHPQTEDDFASLLIPSELGMGRGGAALASEFAGRSTQAFKQAAQQTGKAVGKEGVIRGTLRFPIRSYQAFEDALPSANARKIAAFRGGPEPKYVPPKITINQARDLPLPTGRPPGPLTLAEMADELPMTPAPARGQLRAAGPPTSGVNPNDVPLALQMDRLPQTPAPMTTRSGGPPVRPTTPFNELPLSRQMEQLPQTPAPDVTRAPGPRMQPQTPFHELPLQQQMRELPQTGTVTGQLRATSPPNLPQTPFNELPLYQQMEQLAAEPARPAPVRTRSAIPRMTAPVEAPAAAAPKTPAAKATPAAAAGLSEADKAGLAEKYPGLPIDKVEKALGVTPATPHPLDPSRKGIGAEKTGRLVGKTKQEVRDVATPVLDELQGEASPILPKGALTKIIDTMKALPPGAEREAYVARATSGKNRAQIENIRRTLEHLGLLTAATTGIGTVRDVVKSRLQTEGRD